MTHQHANYKQLRTLRRTGAFQGNNKKASTHAKNNMQRAFNRAIKKYSEYEKVWASIGVKREKVETEQERVYKSGRY